MATTRLARSRLAPSDVMRLRVFLSMYNLYCAAGGSIPFDIPQAERLRRQAASANAETCSRRLAAMFADPEITAGTTF